MRSSSLHHNPLIVWRIENAAGEGPYYETAASKGAGPKRSRPVIDFGVRVEDEKAWWASHRGWRFGFAHKEDAVDWFGEAGLRKLAEKGYRLVPKEAAIVEPSQSGMQVFYLPVEKKLSGKEQMRDLQKQIETAAAAEGWDREAQFSLAIWTIASLCRDARENWPFDKGLLARYLRELKQYQQPGESVREAWDRYAKQVKFRKRRRNPVEQYGYDDDDDYEDDDVDDSHAYMLYANPDVRLNPAVVDGKQALRDYITDFLEATQPHPFDTSSIYNGHTVVDLRPFNGKIHLSWIQTLKPKSGAATETMKFLTELADKHGVAMSLSAVPKGRGETKIPKAKLVAFYKRFGFTGHPDDMVREPVDL